MIVLLRLIFVAILAVMLSVTTWASLGQSLLDFIRGPVSGDRWFLATLADAYCGFITFYLWVAYKETSLGARLGWLVAILLLGNIAMAVYCLIQLVRVPAGAPLADVLLRRRSP